MKLSNKCKKKIHKHFKCFFLKKAVNIYWEKILYMKKYTYFVPKFFNTT